jgi:uncharacterized protein
MPLYEKRENENLLRVLRKMQQNSEIEGGAIVTVEGLSLASTLPVHVEEDVIAASAALGASLAANLIETIKQQRLDQVYIKCQHGTVIIMPLSNEALLLVLSKAQAKLGLIFLDIAKGWNSRDVDSPLASAPEPIIPPRPPKSLNARAKPRYDD